MCACAYVCVHVCVHHVLVNVCACVYVCVCVHVCMCMQHVCMCMQHVCMCACVCITMCVCTCVYGTHLSTDGMRENAKSVQTPAIKATQQCSAAFIQHTSLLSTCYQDLHVVY